MKYKVVNLETGKVAQGFSNRFYSSYENARSAVRRYLRSYLGPAERFRFDKSDSELSYYNPAISAYSLGIRKV